MPVYRNAINYYLSPFNILFLILKDHILAIHLIIYLKITTIGLSILYYLKNKFKSNSILLLIPALCFSLCGWIDAYHINIMWIDALIFIPLITLGIENLINNKKYKLYIFSLAGAIIINYYMGYMLCIYSAIYFLFYNIYKIKDGSFKYILNELSKNILYFICTSLLSVLLSCIVLLPIIKVSNTMEEKTIYMSNPYLFNIIDVFSSHMIANTPTLLADNTKTPNLYTSVFTIMMFIPFILNKKITKKTKIIYSLLLGTILSIMCISYFDFIINIFHIPAGFPYRYSYMYSFILIIILAYQLLKYEESNKWNYILSFIFIIGMIISIYIFKSNKISNDYLIYSIIACILYLIVLLLSKYKISKILLIILVVSELAMTFVYSLNDLYTTKELEEIHYKHINDDGISKPKSNEFYRVETVYRGRTLPLMKDYYSMSSTSSMNYAKVYYLINNLGNETDYSALSTYTTGSVVSEMLFGIKSISYPNYIRNNNYILTIMYAIDSKQTRELVTSKDMFNDSNKIVNELSHIDNIYTKNTYKSKSTIYEDDNFIVYKYIYPNNTSIYVNFSRVAFVITGGLNYSIYNTEINNKFEYDYNIKSKHPKILKIENNELIACYLKDDVNEDYIKAYSYDEKKLKELYDYLNRYPIELKEFKEDYIEGTIKVDQDMSMMSSIPYDEGWHVYIDDKEVDTYGQYDALLGFDIPKGNHNIKLKYSIPYLKEGSIVSLITLVSIISFELIKKHKKNKA